MTKRVDFLYNLNDGRKEFIEEIEYIILQLQKELSEKERMYNSSNDTDKELIHNEINILCAKISSFLYTLSLVY